MQKIVFTVTNEISFDQRMHRVCTALAMAGNEVWLVGREKKFGQPLPRESYTSLRLSTWFRKGKLFYLEFNIRLFYFLLRQAFDVVGSVDFDTLPGCYLAAKIKGKKIAFDAHEYFPELPELAHRPISKYIWHQLGKLLLPGVDLAYTVNESLAEIMQKTYRKDFGVVRNLPLPSPTSRVSKAPPPPFFLLYQGVLNKGRGLEIAIRAMAELPDCQLWLAGEGDLSKELRELAKEKGLEEKVIFMGYLSPADLKEITRKAFLGLNLLENLGLNYYYSLANKTFDYIQAELPAVSMAFPEYIKLNRSFRVQILLNDLSVSELVRVVKSLQKDEMLYSELTNNCKAASAVYNWHRESPGLLALYNQIQTQ